MEQQKGSQVKKNRVSEFFRTGHFCKEKDEPNLRTLGVKICDSKFNNTGTLAIVRTHNPQNFIEDLIP